MEINKKLHSVALASAALILFLILVSSIASAATEQSASQVGPYAYITNSMDSTISVIDTATNTVTATVPVGSEPYGIAVSQAGTKVYVTNFGGDSVSVIDAATNTVTVIVPVGDCPVAFGQFIGTPSVQPVLPIATFSASPTSGKSH